MATELAKAYVQIVPSADGISGSITSALDSEANRAGQSAGGKISGGIVSGIGSVATAGAAAIGAVAAAGGAATGMLVSGIDSVAEYGDNIEKMSQKMGFSFQGYQEWDAIMQHNGSSIQSVRTSMVTLSKQAEKNSDEFKKLGISQEDLTKMNQQELFEATIKGLQNMGEGTERTALATKLLGRGAKELGPLLNMSAEDTENMRQRVHELGGVMSDEAVKSAAAYEDSLQDMQTAFAGLSRGLLSEFLPSLTQVMDGLTEVFSGNSEQGVGMITEGIQSMLAGIGEALPQVAEIATQIVTALAETFVANLPLIVESGLSIIGTLAQAIFENLPLVGEALMGVIDVIGNTLVEYGPMLLEHGFTIIQNLVMGIINGLPVFLENLNTMLTQGFTLLDENGPGFLDKGIAFIEQVANGILQNLPAIITNLGEIVTKAVSFLMEHLPDFMQKGIELIGSLAQGVLNNLPKIIQSLVQVNTQLIATIAQHLPEYLKKGIEMLGQVGAGLIQAIPQLLSMLPQIFSDVTSEIGSYDWLSIGLNIIEGIADGVISAASSLASAAIDAVSGAWDAMVGWLGIASPSKKARDIIGKNWALGIGEGFEENMPDGDMLATVNNTMSTMSGDIRNAATSGSQNIATNDDIVDAIMTLRESILSMKITFETGQVIGGIFEGTDDRLGKEAQRLAWQ